MSAPPTIWEDGRQFDLLPEQARDLEDDGVIYLCAECSAGEGRVYHITDDYIASLGANTGGDPVVFDTIARDYPMG